MNRINAAIVAVLVLMLLFGGCIPVVLYVVKPKMLPPTAPTLSITDAVKLKKYADRKNLYLYFSMLYGSIAATSLMFLILIVLFLNKRSFGEGGTPAIAVKKQ